MATLAEIIAARKAGEATPPAPTVAPKAEEEKELAKVDTKAIEQTVAEPVKEEPATAPVPKPMSFAERMALKKKQEAAANSAAAPTSSQPATAISDKEIAGNVQAPAATTALAQDAKPSSAAPATTPVSEDTTTQPGDEVSAETRQAYADIKEKIEFLNSMSDTDLESGMKDLKAALMKNPAAVSLMEDTDIGQMVIALRRYTGEAIAEAQKEKKPGRKAKDKPVDLSNPDAIAAVFEEL